MHANALYQPNSICAHFATKFTTSELQLLYQHSITREFSKKEFIYYTQTNTYSVFLLEEGLVKIGNFTAHDKEFIKSVIYPGQLFGTLGLIGEKEHGNFARCLSKKVKVTVFRMEQLQSLMSEHNLLSQKIMAQVGQQLYKIEQKLASFIFKSAHERIVDLFKDLAHEVGISDGDSVLIKSIFTQRDIGVITGVSRQSVSKIIANLKHSNQICINRKNLLIRNIDCFK